MSQLRQQSPRWALRPALLGGIAVLGLGVALLIGSHMRPDDRPTAPAASRTAPLPTPRQTADVPAAVPSGATPSMPRQTAEANPTPPAADPRAGSPAVAAGSMPTPSAPANAPVAPAPPRDVAAAPQAVAPRTAQPTATKPAFDVVRVSPQGQAVVAGTAVPDQTIILREGGREIGRTTADAGGQWVIMPDQPLAPGGRELTLSARTGSGAEIAADGSVLLAVPDRPDAHPTMQTAGGTAPPQQVASASPNGAVAVLAPSPGSNEAARVLQAPTGNMAGKAAPLDLGVVDYDAKGAVSLSGHAPPGAHVRIYVDNRPVAETTADPQARWAEKPEGITPGQHQVRIDQVDAQGKVLNRVELPFVREAMPVAVAPGQIVVQPGATLWRLARHTYGQGARYTVIYAYNNEIIRNPDLIYPGQIFRMPDAATAAAIPPAR